MEKDLVSILIPVYNRVYLVGETIESALIQTYKNIEIIIVDNCSTDGTWEVLNDYASKDKRIRIFRNDENIGPVRNWKRCIDEAKGEYAGLLFSDDTYHPEFVSEAIKLFANDVAFVISKVRVYKEKIVVSETNYNNLKQIYNVEFIRDKLLQNKYYFPVSPSSTLFRLKDLSESLVHSIPNPEKLVFENYGAGNDMLIFLLIALKYPTIKFTSDYYVNYKTHKDSLSISNKLEIYYSYASLYFIKTQYPLLNAHFNKILLLRCLRNKAYFKIFNYSNKRISYPYLLNKVFSIK